jgi:DNA primase
VARVPEAELERIKREVSIVRLVEARGVKLSGSGDNLMGLCPLPGHDDRSPSLVVSPSKNIWHCLGACQTGGSVIDWVMRAEGVSFRLAVEMLRKHSVRSTGQGNADAKASSGVWKANVFLGRVFNWRAVRFSSACE